MQQIFHIFIVAKNEPKGFRYNGLMPKIIKWGKYCKWDG